MNKSELQCVGPFGFRVVSICARKRHYEKKLNVNSRTTNYIPLYRVELRRTASWKLTLLGYFMFVIAVAITFVLLHFNDQTVTRVGIEIFAFVMSSAFVVLVSLKPIDTLQRVDVLNKLSLLNKKIDRSGNTPTIEELVDILKGLAEIDALHPKQSLIILNWLQNCQPDTKQLLKLAKILHSLLYPQEYLLQSSTHTNECRIFRPMMAILTALMSVYFAVLLIVEFLADR